MSGHPIRLLVTDDLERRRVTVLFRLLLGIPHYIWFALWTFVVFFAAVLNWFATLALGRSPGTLHRFLAAYVKYATQLYAYMSLAAEPYPAFDGQDGYPIDLRISAPARQSRWKVALRLPMAIPAFALGTALIGNAAATFEGGERASFSGGGLLWVLAVLAWFAILARGRMPRGLRDTAAWALFYGAQLWGYVLLLTDRYPDSDPMAALTELPVRSDPISLEGEDDLRRSRLTTLFRLPLCFPHLLWLAMWGIVALVAAALNWFATLAMGRSPAPLYRFLAAYLRYAMSVYAFLYMLANPFPGFVGAVGTYPLEVSVAERARQSRWGVLFRLVLVIPAGVIMGAYGAVLALAAFFGWFASLITGRMPQGLRNAGVLALRYQSQVTGYVMLLTSAYPYTGPSVGAGAHDVPAAVPEAPAPAAIS